LINAAIFLNGLKKVLLNSNNYNKYATVGLLINLLHDKIRFHHSTTNSLHHWFALNYSKLLEIYF